MSLLTDKSSFRSCSDLKTPKAHSLRVRHSVFFSLNAVASIAAARIAVAAALAAAAAVAARLVEACVVRDVFLPIATRT